MQADDEWDARFPGAGGVAPWERDPDYDAKFPGPPTHEVIHMTKARRVSLGESTQSQRADDIPIDDDFEPDGSYAGGEKVGIVEHADVRICKRCEAAAEDDTAYSVIVAKSGLGHYQPEAGTTLCGLDTGSW